MRAAIVGLAMAAVALGGCPSTSTEGPAPTAAPAPKPIPSGMPFEPLHALPTREEGSYRVDLPALHQVIALATAGQLPVAEADGGYRVLRADEARLGRHRGAREGASPSPSITASP